MTDIYPSDEEIRTWRNDYAYDGLYGTIDCESISREQYIARKACDWQAARDAEICEGNKVGANQDDQEGDRYYDKACKDCASAIRSGRE